MRRSGVRIPLAPPQADIRSGCRFFRMPGRCCGACCCVALAPLVFRAPRVLCWAGLLGVPVGGGPPASRPRRELRSVRRLVVRPGLATARWHRSQAPQALHPALAHIAAGRTRNVACNSPATCSSHEIITLELQRFQTLLKLHPIELHAFFGGKNLPPPSALRLGSRSLRCPPY